MNTIRVLGNDIVCGTIAEIANAAAAWGAHPSKVCRLVFTLNVDHVVLQHLDPVFAAAYAAADAITADGMPIVWLSRMTGKSVSRITGADLVPLMCSLASQRGLSIYVLGGQEDSLAGALNVLRRSYPELKIAGHQSPPFGFTQSASDNERALGLIASADPDILFVALGAPTQERWLVLNRDRISARVAFAVGGAIDFVSGAQKRAPVFLQSIGLEWAWRLAHDPIRLGRRYCIRDLRFAIIAMTELKKALGRSVRQSH